MKHNLIIFIFFSLLFLIYCQTKNDGYDLKIETIQTYGDSSKHIISFVQDFQFYRNKVYILDARQLSILVYDVTGQFLSEIQLHSGKGPAEFSSMGLIAFEIVSDSILAMMDAIERKVEFISFNKKYIDRIDLGFHPLQLFMKDSCLYVTGNNVNKIIWKYNLKGDLLDSLITPFKTPSTLPSPFFSMATTEGNGVFYITNPYRTEIVKWTVDRGVIWDFHQENLNLVKLPEIKTIGKHWAGYQTKGWTINGIIPFGEYLIASTFSVDKGEKQSPHVLLLNKTTGRLLLQKETKEPFVVKFYQNNKYIFSPVYEPYPCLRRIKLIINEG